VEGASEAEGWTDEVGGVGKVVLECDVDVVSPREVTWRRTVSRRTAPREDSLCGVHSNCALRCGGVEKGGSDGQCVDEVLSSARGSCWTCLRRVRVRRDFEKQDGTLRESARNGQLGSQWSCFTGSKPTGRRQLLENVLLNTLITYLQVYV